MEIDLTKPLLSKFWLKGRIWKIQYEGIRMICFKCGATGHDEEHCPTNLQNEVEGLENNNAQLELTTIDRNKSKQKPEEHDTFGSWMLVKKPVKKITPRPDKTTHPGNKVAEGGDKTAGKSSSGKLQSNRNSNHVNEAVTVGGGSRFSILGNSKDFIQDQNMVTNQVVENMEV